MHIEESDRGFKFLIHPANLPPHERCRLASESSAVGPYPDSFERPGSSFLWIGDKHHLNREEVALLAAYLNLWLAHGTFPDAIERFSNAHRGGEGGSSGGNGCGPAGGDGGGGYGGGSAEFINCGVGPEVR